MEKKIVTKVRFRSNYNLGDYNDDETGFAPSITDSSGYEELSDMVKKFLRTGNIPSLNGRGVPVYTVGDDVDPERAIAEMDVTRTEGFDLADAAFIRQRGEKAVSDLKTSKQISDGSKKAPVKNQAQPLAGSAGSAE